MSELADLRATLARAQRELEAASARLESFESVRKGEASATVLVPRVVDRQRRKMIIVGALSSLGTAALLGLFALAFSNDDPPPRPPIAIAPLPPAPLPAPSLPTTVVAQLEAPPPPPPPPEPPRPPTRVARKNPDSSTTRARPAEPEPQGTGQLTIVCLPMRCDSITDNGVVIGPGHIFNRPVPAGMHTVGLHVPSGETKTISVVVQPDRNKEIRVNMRPDVSDVF